MNQSSLKKIRTQLQRLHAEHERMGAMIASLEQLVVAEMGEAMERGQGDLRERRASKHTPPPLPSEPIGDEERLSALLARWTQWADAGEPTRKDTIHDYAGRFKRVLEWFLAAQARPMTIADLQAQVMTDLLEPLAPKARRKYRTATREFIGWLNNQGVTIDRYEVVPVSSPPKRDVNTAL